jgi:hypothetical protein
VKSVIVAGFLLLSAGFRFPVCECDDVSIADAVKYSDVIAVGKAVKIEKVKRYRRNSIDTTLWRNGWTNYTRYTFNVKDIFKGPPETGPIYVLVEVGKEGCGLPMVSGNDYVLYAHQSEYDGEYETDRCSRTKPYDPGEVNEIKKALR